MQKSRSPGGSWVGVALIDCLMCSCLSHTERATGLKAATKGGDMAYPSHRKDGGGRVCVRACVCV